MRCLHTTCRDAVPGSLMCSGRGKRAVGTITDCASLSLPCPLHPPQSAAQLEHPCAAFSCDVLTAVVLSRAFMCLFIIKNISSADTVHQQHHPSLYKDKKRKKDAWGKNPSGGSSRPTPLLQGSTPLLQGSTPASLPPPDSSSLPLRLPGLSFTHPHGAS